MQNQGQDQQNNELGEDRLHQYRLTEFYKSLINTNNYASFFVNETSNANSYLFLLVYYFVPSVQELKNAPHRTLEKPKRHWTYVKYPEKNVVVFSLVAYDIFQVEFLN